MYFHYGEIVVGSFANFVRKESKQGEGRHEKVWKQTEFGEASSCRRIKRWYSDYSAGVLDCGRRLEVAFPVVL